MVVKHHYHIDYMGSIRGMYIYIRIWLLHALQIYMSFSIFCLTVVQQSGQYVFIVPMDSADNWLSVLSSADWKRHKFFLCHYEYRQLIGDLFFMHTELTQVRTQVSISCNFSPLFLFKCVFKHFHILVHDEINKWIDTWVYYFFQWYPRYLSGCRRCHVQGHN